MPRRILFVTTTYPLTPGDATPGFVADLAQALVRDQGLAVRVIAPHHGGAVLNEIVAGVEIERFQYTRDPARQCVAYGGGIPDNLRNFPKAKFQLPRFFAAMYRAVRRHRDWADLIHAHWVEPGLIAMAANRGKKPLIVTVHSLRPRATRLHRFTLKRADRVLFNSQYTLSQANEKGYACASQVVYQGYDDALFGRLPRGAVQRGLLGIPADAPVVLALGRWIEVKGLHVLTQSAGEFLQSRPRAHLVIAGDGPMRAQIEQIVAQSPVRDRIHLPGALRRPAVAEWFAEADLFVNPGIVDSSGRAEGLGITTIEAMASGLACVGSAVGGIPETILHEETGLLIPPDDPIALSEAIGRLLDDARLRGHFGQAGREAARSRFTWPVLAGQVAEVYAQFPQ